jgi:hypothetical protein
MLFGTITRWPASFDCVVAVTGTTDVGSAADFLLLLGVVIVDDIIVTMSSFLIA